MIRSLSLSYLPKLCLLRGGKLVVSARIYQRKVSSASFNSGDSLSLSLSLESVGNKRWKTTAGAWDSASLNWENVFERGNKSVGLRCVPCLQMRRVPTKWFESLREMSGREKGERIKMLAETFKDTLLMKFFSKWIEIKYKPFPFFYSI